MAKVMFSLVALVLAGCSSMGEWRELSIDGNNESSFNESLNLLNDELSYSRSQMFALALVDIVRTEIQNSEKTSDGDDDTYTDEDFRGQLHGLTYEGVIALADQTGPSISNLYSSGARRHHPSSPGQAWPQTDPNRFPPSLVMPPGMASMSP